MQRYRLDVPANVPTTHTIAPSRAPAVHVGDPLDDLKLLAAVEEIEDTRALQKAGFATQEEVGASMSRHFKIGCQHVPPAGHGEAPLYFVQFEANINQKLSEISTSLGEIDNKLKILDVRVRNEKVRSFNRAVLKAPKESKMEFRKVFKERGGKGEGLPGSFARLEGPGDCEIGSSPPSHFPKDKCALYMLSHGQLDYLSKFYNDNFNITPDLSLVECREQFDSFISYG